MDRLKITKYLILLLVFLILGRFYGGVYEDDEFDERYFFIKNTPTWKWHFYSPIGMSSQKLEDISEDQKKEQLSYDKFVLNRLISFPIW